MKFEKTLLAFLVLLFPLILFAQVESTFNDIQMDQSLQEVSQKVNAISESSTLIDIDEPSFPLARDKEAHLVCKSVKTDHGIISSAVFTFADDRLVYIEARGNTYKTFASKRNDTAETYMDYEIYDKDMLFLNKKKDMAWILNEEGVHNNLFTWSNPYLDSGTTPKAGYTESIPEFLRMGHSIDELQPLLEKNSNFTTLQELDGSDPNAQLQINCFGVEYMGFPRKIEARFGDNVLNVVWILTGKGEEDRIRQALLRQFGDPVYVNEAWEIYDNWQVGLRKDKPEVLLMKKEVGLAYKTSYFKQ